MQDKRFALLTIISIAVIGIVIGIVAAADFSFGHLNNSLSGTGINANATDFITSTIKDNTNITNATPWIHYVEAGNASDIQAKIDSLPASGGMVFVPAGVYNTTAIGAIITKSNVILCGAGDSTVITSSGSNTLIEVANAEGVSIRDMAFEKGYQKQIIFYNAHESEIPNCKFSDVNHGPFGYPDTYVCIELNASCKNILKNLRIHRGGLLFYNNSDYNIVSECNCPRFDYLYLEQSNNNIIQRSSFKTNARLFLANSSYNKLVSNEFELTGGTHITDGSCHNLIEGNHIISANPVFCIDLMIGSYEAGDNDYNKIVSNTFRQVRIYFASNEVKGNFNRHNIIVNNDMNGEKGIGCDAGIYIKPSEVVAGFVDDAHNLISGNKIYNYNSRSIYLKESCYNTITENECWNSSQDGILLWMHSDYNTVSNNNCHDNADCGIMLEDSNRYNIVTDNYCNDNEKDGIMLFKSDNNIVSDNYLYHNGYCGLWVRDESDGNTISGNIAAKNGWNLGGLGAADAPWSGIRVGTNCDNNQINSNRCFEQMWGISITDSGSENNMVHDNYVLGNGNGGIADSGVGSDIKDNKER